MRVTLKSSRLRHHSRFCLSTYTGTAHGERAERYFVITDADKAPPGGGVGSAPVVCITPWYHEALAFMKDETRGSK
jgi:hypothetical protein